MRNCFVFVFCLTIYFAEAQEAGINTDTKEVLTILETVKSLEIKGTALYESGNYQEAAFVLQSAAETLEKNNIKDHDLLANCYQKTAMNYAALEWYGLAETFSFKSIQYARHLEKPIALVLDFAVLGEIYHKQGKFDKALSYYDSCLQIDRLLRDTVYVANDLSAIGRINTQIGREQKGIQQLKEAVSMTKEQQDLRAQCLSLNALGLGYANCKDYESARQYIMESLVLSQQIRDTNLIINRFINLGDLHVKRGETEVAEMYLQRSLSLINNTFQPHRYTVIYRNLGAVYRHRKDYEKAIFYYQEALEIAEDKALLPEVRLIYKHLQVLHRAKGNYEKALDYAEKFSVASDSIFSINSRIRADIFNHNYALAKKEKAIQTLHLTNELKQKDLQNLHSQRKWLWLSLLLLSLLGGVSFYAFRQRQERLIQVKEAKIANQLHQISKLQAEIATALAENDRSILAATLTFNEINQLLSNPLTEREFEILQLVIQGKNNKEIAGAIFLSVNTVKFHLKNLYVKLEVKNRMQAIQRSLKK